MSEKKEINGGELGGVLGGLGDLLEKLGELADKGQQLKESGSFGDSEGLSGVYGFSIKTNLAEGRKGGVRVEPFGNVRKEKETGRVRVHEVAEPLIDIFEEADHTLVLAEMPGISIEDINVELNDDILTIQAERGPKKYYKEAGLL